MRGMKKRDGSGFRGVLDYDLGSDLSVRTEDVGDGRKPVLVSTITCPPGTDPVVFRRVARDFCRALFASGIRFHAVLHDSGTPHVHLVQERQQ